MALTMDSPTERPGAARAGRVRMPGGNLNVRALGRDAEGRAELEAYVRDAFQAKHGATVRSFMPTLLSFRDRAGVLRGVAGLRGAHEEHLYLEQYLSLPVEQTLAERLAARGVAPEQAPVRRQIVEVGNLAGANCRAAVRMVAQLPAWLTAQRYTWIVFTATGTLQHILGAFRAPLIELAQADASSVARSADEWGRYYETRPRVYAGRLGDATGLAGFARLPDIR
jgi:hypothetical protein